VPLEEPPPSILDPNAPPHRLRQPTLVLASAERPTMITVATVSGASDRSCARCESWRPNATRSRENCRPKCV
jgi:hypothetical protein